MRLDADAPADVAREYDLTDREAWTLVTLARCAPTTGTASGAAPSPTSPSRRAPTAGPPARPSTVSRSAGWSGEVRPFGKNREGVVLVVVYTRLRSPTSDADRDTDHAIAQFCANGDSGREQNRVNEGEPIRSPRVR